MKSAESQKSKAEGAEPLPGAEAAVLAASPREKTSMIFFLLRTRARMMRGDEPT
jgi:hypothetical protein